MIKTKFLACAALLLGATSCLGPNNATNSLRNWNATVTDMDWADELLFLGMNIVPVYGIAMFADVVVLNTIDYWTGENPVSEPGAFPDADFSNK
ncbi:MAG: DUF3332 family protein [Planctomycetota bacterium]